MIKQYRLRSIYCSLVALCLFGFAFTTEGRCEVITIRFSGTVTSILARPEFRGIDFPEVGDSFTGFYRFESTAPDIWPSTEIGLFEVKSLNARIGNLQVEGWDNTEQLYNTIATFRDSYFVHSEPLEIPSHPELAAQIRGINFFSLTVSKNDLFADPNTLPLFPPLLNSELQRHLVLELGNKAVPGPPGITDARIVATLDSLTRVPEPSSLPLLGLAWMFLLRELTRTRRPL
jgi:hypothetical protein